MQRKRVVVQERGCECDHECDGGPTPYPLEGINEIGEHCLAQGASNGDENGKCRFLYWLTLREVDPKKIKGIHKENKKNGN